jgi:hypothetical protein
MSTWRARSRRVATMPSSSPQAAAVTTPPTPPATRMARQRTVRNRSRPRRPCRSHHARPGAGFPARARRRRPRLPISADHRSRLPIDCEHFHVRIAGFAWSNRWEVELGEARAGGRPRLPISLTVTYHLKKDIRPAELMGSGIGAAELMGSGRGKAPRGGAARAAVTRVAGRASLVRRQAGLNRKGPVGAPGRAGRRGFGRSPGRVPRPRPRTASPGR